MADIIDFARPAAPRVTMTQENAADAAIHAAARQALARFLDGITGPFGQDDAQRSARDALLHALLTEMHAEDQLEPGGRFIIETACPVTGELEISYYSLIRHQY